MTKATTDDKYKMRNSAIRDLRKAIIKKGGKITPLSKSQKNILTADFKLDNKVVKVKVAKHKNVSVLFEVKNDGRPSWWNKTRANIFCMVYVEPKIAYLINIMATRDWIANPLNAIEIYKTYSGTECFSIPIEELMRNNLIVDTIQL